jgi:hypothetical protein
MPSTTAIVFASALDLRIGRYTERWPSIRTMLVWIAESSFALPTSATRTGAPLNIFSGRLLISATVLSWLLV